jgi:hypothetical protein
VANQVCALITRHDRQARIDANEFDSDVLTVPLITVFFLSLGFPAVFENHG